MKTTNEPMRIVALRRPSRRRDQIGVDSEFAAPKLCAVYPSWSFYPRNLRPPEWAVAIVAATTDVKAQISTFETPAGEDPRDTLSDAVLAHLRPGLHELGYQVETGKKQAEKIIKPVLFGNDGSVEVAYEIDAFHESLGIAVEVEAGRGAANGADYRDIVRTSLLLDAANLALLIPAVYRFTSGGRPQEKKAYESTRRQLDAIYASRRLRLPFDGVLLVGY
ncbi:hypothetical protein SFC88_14470 [Nocardioides sp. HM23]|uniref:hypothetical protein n=1 Tax=Nocardioides bizhenqiangii TaxID=3095076 RepID=UPI002ACADEBE|nr:hypothetical protein [Nocardioides sp. HM23]MDZ5622048.1 hypothetical protein [Nocardioides sp. HM23]